MITIGRLSEYSGVSDYVASEPLDSIEENQNWFQALKELTDLGEIIQFSQNWFIELFKFKLTNI